MRSYVANIAYCRACREGAARVNLMGHEVGVVTSAEADNAAARIAGFKAWQKKRKAAAKAAVKEAALAAARAAEIEAANAAARASNPKLREAAIEARTAESVMTKGEPWQSESVILLPALDHYRI